MEAGGGGGGDLLGHGIYKWKLLFDGYTVNRCSGGREWKYIPQICKDTLLGTTDM